MPGKRAVQDALQQQATQKEYRDAVHKAVAKIVETGLGGKQVENILPEAKPDESIPLKEDEEQTKVENTGLDDTIEGNEVTIAGLPKTTKESVETKLSTYLLNPDIFLAVAKQNGLKMRLGSLMIIQVTWQNR